MITTTALTKSYGGARVVSGVSMHCEPGTITGFIGPNGAGKSTTLRMIVGLVRPDHGTATVEGRPFADLPNPARVVGTLLDANAVNGGRTGRATLATTARMAGVGADRVDELLGLVGLPAAADRRVGTYSLGMRQRLGIAHAMVGDPTVLIMDEPANGLDPEGIAWMRGLLREFADRGGTVLLSSHLLQEVEATVDRLVVISQGAVVASGAIGELLASSTLLVRTPGPQALAAALRAEGVTCSPGPHQTLTVDTAGGRASADLVARIALDHQIVLTELRQAGPSSLEQLFFSLTATASATAPALAEEAA